MNIKRNAVICGLIMAMSVLFSCMYINEKSGYYIDEGMTLFLSNGNYNGAVTSESEYGFVDFLNTFVI